ncbi:hypothetical protein UPYG_G00024490 [Umbra pygmaea]|uniref:Uncharacterized protein n=1 Tax=Umbra pygmaea TaxID=75934 RepID=A0ABD0XLL1_UMBPY
MHANPGRNQFKSTTTGVITVFERDGRGQSARNLFSLSLGLKAQCARVSFIPFICQEQVSQHLPFPRHCRQIELCHLERRGLFVNTQIPSIVLTSDPV